MATFAKSLPIKSVPVLTLTHHLLCAGEGSMLTSEDWFEFRFCSHMGSAPPEPQLALLFTGLHGIERTFMQAFVSQVLSNCN